MTNQEFYNSKLNTEEISIKQVGWENVDKAKHRYHRISEIVNLSGSKSIVDYGCGLGDFVSYVNKEIKYTGVDVHDAYIQKAQLIHKDELFFNIVGDGKIPKCDIAVNIGAWTLNGGKNHYEYWIDIKNQVDKILSTANILVVNGFHQSVDFQDPKLFYHDMNEWMKLAIDLDYEIEIEMFERFEFILKIY